MIATYRYNITTLFCVLSGTPRGKNPRLGAADKANRSLNESRFPPNEVVRNVNPVATVLPRVKVCVALLLNITPYRLDLHQEKTPTTLLSLSPPHSTPIAATAGTPCFYSSLPSPTEGPSPLPSALQTTVDTAT